MSERVLDATLGAGYQTSMSIRTHTFAADEVETVSPSRVSLMPDGQMSGLTPQEAADLLEYLVQRK